jgi:hypothetical protein
MKRTKKFFTLLAFIAVLAFLAGKASPLFSQTTNAEQAKEEALKISEQAKTEARARSEQQKAEVQILPDPVKYEVVVKTYSLKYIDATDLLRLAKFYIIDSTSLGNVLTIRIFKKDIPAFEELLKKVDVDKKSIRFKVYPIIASREPISKGESEKEGSARIENKDLKKVLDEMTGVWNFKYFRTDDPSFLIVKNGSGSNSASLLSKFGFLNLTIVQPQIRGEKAGERIIAAKQIRLVRTSNFITDAPIDTQDIIIKENGYLVVGVGSLFGQQAIILILSAEII